MPKYKRAIIVWRFEDAPKEYQKFSSGDDVDWVAFVPDCHAESYIAWLEEGSAFGCCSVTQNTVKGGKIYIGYHA
jgi:hypothetical protein